MYIFPFSERERPHWEVVVNIADGLRINSWRDPQKIAAVFEDKRVTYAELNARANQLAHAMLKKGFERQDKISILMYNNIEFLEIYQGLIRAALISVPINFRLVQAELEYIINNSDSVGLFIGIELFEKINPDNIPLVKKENIIVISSNELTPEGYRNYEDFIAGCPEMNRKMSIKKKTIFSISGIHPVPPDSPKGR
tara:strand:- start:794 stop:1384 length:591 start_codon:yes stop_codon:yes gene_type:complete